ncbi:DMT family transporter [Sulfitobacter aestuariivivens]|uniref:DMT family transporter n=1 Tax=Sulfitobacter aestuariivivens TaxID=2766981 RepID=A0A927D262_9RHOB|nr:DMT family transporter [Sulfitobacter aestuariivivens]MBD3663735.1 DMT family transporter [Sulfitobacter aestuariivivens]
MTAAPNITWKSWLMVMSLAFVWGGTFMVTELALRGITPFWLAASRIGFAALVMTSIWATRGFALFERRLTRGEIISVLIIGAASSAVPFSLLAWGQQHVTSGFAGVSMASSALIVLPLAHFLVPGERLTLRRVAGFAIGFCGVAILIGGQALESAGSALEMQGRIACVAASACYATSAVLMRRLPPVDPIGLATVVLIVATTLIVPAALAAEGVPPLPDGQTLAILGFLGLIPTAAANLLRVLVIRSAGPVFMSLVNYQVPVWSVVLGALILSEPLPSSMLFAMSFILAGVALSQLDALKSLFARS